MVDLRAVAYLHSLISHPCQKRQRCAYPVPVVAAWRQGARRDQHPERRSGKWATWLAGAWRAASPSVQPEILAFAIGRQPCAPPPFSPVAHILKAADLTGQVDAPLPCGSAPAGWKVLGVSGTQAAISGRQEAHPKGREFAVQAEVVIASICPTASVSVVRCCKNIKCRGCAPYYARSAKLVDSPALGFASKMTLPSDAVPRAFIAENPMRSPSAE